MVPDYSLRRTPHPYPVRASLRLTLPNLPTFRNTNELLDGNPPNTDTMALDPRALEEKVRTPLQLCCSPAMPPRDKRQLLNPRCTGQEDARERRRRLQLLQQQGRQVPERRRPLRPGRQRLPAREAECVPPHHTSSAHRACADPGPQTRRRGKPLRRRQESTGTS